MREKNFIVLAEDDEDDQMLFQTALDSEIKLKIIESGDKLLEYFKTGEELPDLLFLDLNMPGISGRDVLTFLKSEEQFKYLPVIVFSTSAAPADIRAAYDLGASAYLVKPSSYEVLKQMIFCSVNFWLKSNKAFYPNNFL